MGNPFQVLINMSGEFPEIKSTHSLVAKHVTKEKWDKLKNIETKTCGFTLAKACACAIEFDNQHCGIYAGCWDSYKDFAIVFDPLIQEYHGISADAKHTSDMDPSKVNGNINPEVPVHSTRIRVGRNIDGFGLSPGITKQQRIDIEKLMSSALSKLTGDLAGTYYPLTGMDEGGDVKGVFERLSRGIKAVGDSVKAESGKDFALDPRYGYIHSCPTIGTGMRASVHVDLP